ncbi:hypothetical protein BC936DRAFT_149771 [Jimgerdemannia flammicorona]|uniref:Selenocysteine-specific elongation factor n=1 Tax=Jimgerdemannia flammicorona TaxID=994334 RepID=A0A433DJQ2_9FUNG|nr:hypothetical protein BC936DRAFT_149771 [Jimgerdemannia flammicorona]
MVTCHMSTSHILEIQNSGRGVSARSPTMAQPAVLERILNINVGILGHVDSGKTTLAKALSTMASTAAFDKHPQSKARGITLDLGFSAFFTDMPDQVKDAAYDKLQITLVDCPGHASLVKTIIGGAQIIDLMLLVIDATKGVQTQTAECLVIGEITTEKMIVVLNKIDLYPENARNIKIKEMITGLRKTLSKTKFRDAPIVPISANIGAADIISNPLLTPKVENIDDLIRTLRETIRVPERTSSGNFLFAVDHCFAIQGQGTVMTGTVLNGGVAIGNIIEISNMAKKKVKSMQMFRKPVQKASQGDRVGICVTQFDSNTFERGLAFAPGTVSVLHAAIASATKVRFFKEACTSKSKLHVTVGHHTVMATVTFFSAQKPSPDQTNRVPGDFNLTIPYEYQLELSDTSQWALLEFETPVECPNNALVIGSKLDMDIHANVCRIAFHGTVQHPMTSKRYREEDLCKLRVFKWKKRVGAVDRLVDERTIIGKNLFKKDTNIENFLRMEITLSTGLFRVILYVTCFCLYFSSFSSMNCPILCSYLIPYHFPSLAIPTLQAPSDALSPLLGRAANSKRIFPQVLVTR